jgi:hypothetical protein
MCLYMCVHVYIVCVCVCVCTVRVQQFIAMLWRAHRDAIQGFCVDTHTHTHTHTHVIYIYDIYKYTYKRDRSVRYGANHSLQGQGQL